MNNEKSSKRFRHILKFTHNKLNISLRLLSIGRSRMQIHHLDGISKVEMSHLLCVKLLNVSGMF